MKTYCAVCGHTVDRADRHVEVEAETLPREEFANTDDYLFHVGCWDRVSGGWMEPA